MRYVSIDPATKSIAILIIDYNKNKIFLDKLETLSNIDIVFTSTINLASEISNNKLDELDRINLLTDHLNTVIKPYLTEDTTILIERQISGTPTYIIYIALCTYFIIHNMKVSYIAPTLKNTLSIGGCKIDFRKYPNSYIANKEHSRSMFLICKEYFGNNKKIKYNKKMERDLSDCFIQLLYYLANNYT